MIGSSVILRPGETRKSLFTWTYDCTPGSGQPLCSDVVQDAEVDLLVTYSIEGLDPLLPPPAGSDISAAYTIVLIASNGNDPCGSALHAEVEVDFGRGYQFTAPAYTISVFGVYPEITGVNQPPLLVRINIGRGGHGCGCPTRTIVSPVAPALARIPVLAYSAVLITPAPAPLARFLQYTLGGVLIADSPITPETGIEAKVANGAVYFAVTGAPGSSVSFKLSA